jgi:hypothetical protein
MFLVPVPKIDINYVIKNQSYMVSVKKSIYGIGCLGDTKKRFSKKKEKQTLALYYSAAATPRSTLAPRIRPLLPLTSGAAALVTPSTWSVPSVVLAIMTLRKKKLTTKR